MLACARISLPSEHIGVLRGNGMVDDNWRVCMIEQDLLLCEALLGSQCLQSEHQCMRWYELRCVN